MNESTNQNPERDLRRAALKLQAQLRFAGVSFQPSRHGVQIQVGWFVIEVLIGRFGEGAPVVVLRAEIPERFTRPDLEETLLCLVAQGVEGLAIRDTDDGCQAFAPLTPLDQPDAWDSVFRRLRMLTGFGVELARLALRMEQEAA